MVTAPIEFHRFPAAGPSIAGYRRKRPFQSLPALRRVDLGNWNASLYSEVFRTKHLQRLSISGYTGADLSQFHELEDLEELGLGASSIVSLTGASKLPRLSRVALTLVNRLPDLQLGWKVAGVLTHLFIEKARSNIDGLGKLNQLQGSWPFRLSVS